MTDTLPKTVSVPRAVELTGLTKRELYELINRQDDPLPSVPVGRTGTHRRVIVAEIDGWLLRQAVRD